jgi:hypothetical protein
VLITLIYAQDNITIAMNTDAIASAVQKRKMFAGAIIFILMVATLISSLALYKPRSPVEEFMEEKFKIKFGENFAVTSIPQPNNEPAIAIDPNDPLHLVAAGNDYGGFNDDAWVGYYVSWDGGKTWSRDLIPGYLGGPISQLTGYRAAGDPVVCFDSASNVYISGICFKRPWFPYNPRGSGYNVGRDDGIFVAKSTDGGITFDQVRIVIPALSSQISFHDKEWMAVDMNNGNVYVMWVVFTALSRANVLFSRSTDGGNRFSRPIVISEYRAGEINSQGSTIQVTPDGTVHVAWIFNGEAVRYCYSTDQGQSFSTPQSICDVEEIPWDGLPNCGYRTPTLLMSAVDLSDTNTSGSLYITWNDYRFGDADILLIYSRDGSDTWSEPIRVNNDTIGNKKDQFFSAVAVSPQGYVHMIYYDRRNDENNTLLEVYYALSKDGGENFTFQANMTTESFDGNNAPNDFIGDYIGVTASNSTAYGIWCDTREGTPESGSSELYIGSAEFVCDECEHEGDK